MHLFAMQFCMLQPQTLEKLRTTRTTLQTLPPTQGVWNVISNIHVLLFYIHSQCVDIQILRATVKTISIK